jgi:hypothetical protein
VSEYTCTKNGSVPSGSGTFLAELADLKSRHAEEEDSNAESDNSSSQDARIAEAHWGGLESDCEYTDEEGY